MKTDIRTSRTNLVKAVSTLSFPSLADPAEFAYAVANDDVGLDVFESLHSEHGAVVWIRIEPLTESVDTLLSGLTFRVTDADSVAIATVATDRRGVAVLPESALAGRRAPFRITFDEEASARFDLVDASPHQLLDVIRATPLDPHSEPIPVTPLRRAVLALSGRAAAATDAAREEAESLDVGDVGVKLTPLPYQCLELKWTDDLTELPAIQEIEGHSVIRLTVAVDGNEARRREWLIGLVRREGEVLPGFLRAVPKDFGLGPAERLQIQVDVLTLDDIEAIDLAQWQNARRENSGGSHDVILRVIRFIAERNVE